MWEALALTVRAAGLSCCSLLERLALESSTFTRNIPSRDGSAFTRSSPRAPRSPFTASLRSSNSAAAIQPKSSPRISHRIA